LAAEPPALIEATVIVAAPAGLSASFPSFCHESALTLATIGEGRGIPLPPIPITAILLAALRLSNSRYCETGHERSGYKHFTHTFLHRTPELPIAEAVRPSRWVRIRNRPR
jgi:hypothetical protein